MPRFRLSLPDPSSESPSEDRYSDLDELYDAPPRKTPRARKSGPRLAVDGKSGRLTVDVAGAEPDDDPAAACAGSTSEPPVYSSYDVATPGPGPAPDWLVTSLSAVDTRLGGLKSGKEADVSLLDRSVPDGPGCLLAVKTYRTADHRMFHRDSGYQEGRRTRRSREGRAMAHRTRFGRELLAGKWAGAEFEAMSRLWTAGAAVPYPVQLIGSELMMEFIGEPDGTAAPRLAAWEGDCGAASELYHDLVDTLEVLAADGLTHGDLSPYNVLVQDDRCVLIDLPQVVDVVANPQGLHYLDRDCRVIADFFARRGVPAADGGLLASHLSSIATR